MKRLSILLLFAFAFTGIATVSLAHDVGPPVEKQVIFKAMDLKYESIQVAVIENYTAAETTTDAGAIIEAAITATKNTHAFTWPVARNLDHRSRFYSKDIFNIATIVALPDKMASNSDLLMPCRARNVTA